MIPSEDGYAAEPEQHDQTSYYIGTTVTNLSHPLASQRLNGNNDSNLRLFNKHR
jgi:hypothetical protein